MMSNPGWQTVTIHILPNISRNKDNQIITFGQLLEYNTRNIFLKKYTQNVMEKLFPFQKNQDWTYLWINTLKFYGVCFYCTASWELSKYIKTAGANELL